LLSVITVGSAVQIKRSRLSSVYFNYLSRIPGQAASWRSRRTRNTSQYIRGFGVKFISIPNPLSLPCSNILFNAVYRNPLWGHDLVKGSVRSQIFTNVISYCIRPSKRLPRICLLLLFQRENRKVLPYNYRIFLFDMTLQHRKQQKKK
jgi:hypothetical protein